MNLMNVRSGKNSGKNQLSRSDKESVRNRCSFCSSLYIITRACCFIATFDSAWSTNSHTRIIKMNYWMYHVSFPLI